MKLLQFVIILLSVTGFVACAETDTAGNLPVFDLEATIDTPRRSDLSEIAEDIDFISLDNTSEEGLIGEIRQIEESKRGFYIFDYSRTPVKLFDRTGKFISTIGVTGRGPNEFLRFNNIAVNFETDDIYLSAFSTDNHIIAYDFAGHLFANIGNIAEGTMAYYNDKLISLRQSPNISPVPYPDSIVTIVDIFSPRLNITGIINAWDKGSAGIIIGSPQTGVSVISIKPILSDNGNSLLIKESRCDTVFYYKNDTKLDAAYILELGNYSPPPQMYNFGMEKSWSKYYNVINIYESDRYLLIIVRNGIQNDRIPLVVDKNDFEGFAATGSDGKPGLFIDDIAFTPSYIRDNRLVGYMQAFDIVNNAAGITNPDLAALAATLKEDSNPVIVVAKLKK